MFVSETSYDSATFGVKFVSCEFSLVYWMPQLGESGQPARSVGNRVSSTAGLVRSTTGLAGELGWVGSSETACTAAASGANPSSSRPGTVMRGGKPATRAP